MRRHNMSVPRLTELMPVDGEQLILRRAIRDEQLDLVDIWWTRTTTWHRLYWAFFLLADATIPISATHHEPGPRRSVDQALTWGFAVV